MSRRRLTQIFPWILPLRKCQKKIFFYIKMAFDQNEYAKTQVDKLLPYIYHSYKSPLINEHSGQDIKYQYNKVYNLQLAATTINGIIIKPGETFSFWQLVRNADKKHKYKNGLLLVDGDIIGAYGGGLCQLSNTLFYIFLNSPLIIVERHSHAVERFHTQMDDIATGTDATISEGWLDLKMKNETKQSFQIEIEFKDEYMIAIIRSDKENQVDYKIVNGKIEYQEIDGRLFQTAEVIRKSKNKMTNQETQRLLYVNKTEIGYDMSEIIDN